MKKISLKVVVIVLALITMQLQTLAGSTMSVSYEDETIVNFDETEIYNSFEQINDLVSFVSTNDATSYSSIESENNSLVENVSSTAAMVMNTQTAENPLIVPAFMYGCMFSAIGILVVAYVTNNDPDQVKSAATGCLISSIGLPILSIIISILAASVDY
jgi:hypothetical protein